MEDLVQDAPDRWFHVDYDQHIHPWGDASETLVIVNWWYGIRGRNRSDTNTGRIIK